MTTFESLALNALKRAAEASRKPDQSARFIEQASSKHRCKQSPHMLY